MKPRRLPELKPLYLERISKLLTDKKDLKSYLDILKISPVKSFRCNTLKISPEKLKERLEKKGWKIKQPWKNYPEIMVIKKELEPGELGRSLEHQLGYFYIQELASMLPILTLKPKENELVLDLCAAPGSKTTQASAKMQNTGTIIANDVSLGRIRILASNSERCGATNTIITRKDGIAFCKRMKKARILFDKILLDAPCSGEGTLRSSPRTYLMWNPKTISSLSRLQKQLISSAMEILKKNGKLIYSTCTHAPEENEEIVNYVLEKYPEEIKLKKIDLPIKTRSGITEWENKKYNSEVKKCARVYPQDNNTEGFFVSKFKKIR